MKKAMYVLAVMCLVAGVGSAQRIQSFCEYGTGVALRFGAGGALWDQQWGYAPWDWYDCTARPNVGFLNENVGGLLETTTAGAPVIDADLIVRFSFGGNIVLTAYDECNPDAVAGQIFGDVEGLFVADLNADRAIVDEEAGTITILFGAMLHDEPDALINITKTTGKFKSIKAVGGNGLSPARSSQCASRIWTCRRIYLRPSQTATCYCTPMRKLSWPALTTVLHRISRQTGANLE